MESSGFGQRLGIIRLVNDDISHTYGVFWKGCCEHLAVYTTTPTKHILIRDKCRLFLVYLFLVSGFVEPGRWDGHLIHQLIINETLYFFMKTQYDQRIVFTKVDLIDFCKNWALPFPPKATLIRNFP